MSGIRTKQMENGTISFVMSIEYQTQNNTNNYVIPLALVLCYTLVLFLFAYQTYLNTFLKKIKRNRQGKISDRWWTRVLKYLWTTVPIYILRNTVLPIQFNQIEFIRVQRYRYEHKRPNLYVCLCMYVCRPINLLFLM